MLAARKMAEEENHQQGGSRSATVVSASADAVRSWCNEQGLAQFADKLIDSGYDSLAVIAELDKEDLIEIGVDLPGHRKKILLAASHLKGREEL